MERGDAMQLQIQMGQILEGIRSLNELMEIRQIQSEKLQDLLRADFATLRIDQKDLDEKLECVVCVMQHDLEALRAGAAEHAHCVTDLVAAVQALRRPLADIMTLRSKAAGLMLGIGVVGSAALWIAEPIYRWIVETHYLRR